MENLKVKVLCLSECGLMNLGILDTTEEMVKEEIQRAQDIFGTEVWGVLLAPDGSEMIGEMGEVLTI